MGRARLAFIRAVPRSAGLGPAQRTGARCWHRRLAAGRGDARIRVDAHAREDLRGKVAVFQGGNLVRVRVVQGSRRPL